MENQTFIIEDELKKLPGKPGVYLMHGEKDEIIYVGKAISLKNRVRQYFQPSRNRGAKIDQMVTHITRFEYIVTDSELEALVLECNLIKEHRPKYNTMLMDDKSYPFIKVTTGEAYPRIMMARQMKKDKSKYFGPYTSVTAVKDTIESFTICVAVTAFFRAISGKKDAVSIIISSSVMHRVRGIFRRKNTESRLMKYSNSWEEIMIKS